MRVLVPDTFPNAMECPEDLGDWPEFYIHLNSLEELVELVNRETVVEIQKSQVPGYLLRIVDVEFI